MLYDAISATGATGVVCAPATLALPEAFETSSPSACTRPGCLRGVSSVSWVSDSLPLLTSSLFSQFEDPSTVDYAAFGPGERPEDLRLRLKAEKRAVGLRDHPSPSHSSHSPLSLFARNATKSWCTSWPRGILTRKATRLEMPARHCSLLDSPMRRQSEMWKKPLMVLARLKQCTLCDGRPTDSLGATLLWSTKRSGRCARRTKKEMECE